MKSLQITIFFAVFLLSFFNSGAQTKRFTIDKVTAKLKKKNYIGMTLQTFYNDFNGLVKMPTWSDEPPGKLRGAYFELLNTNASFVEVYFNVNPDSVRFNEHRNWTVKNIGKSTITSVELLKGDSTILKLL